MAFNNFQNLFSHFLAIKRYDWLQYGDSSHVHDIPRPFVRVPASTVAGVRVCLYIHNNMSLNMLFFYNNVCVHVTEVFLNGFMYSSFD